MTTSNDNQTNKVRLDKWLWAARFYKTRALAKDTIDGGKVQYNGMRTKPGRIVEVGAEVTLKQGWDEKTVVIKAISDRRRGAPEAMALYEETQDSQRKREVAQAARKHNQAAMLPPARRPTKKQRRQIHRFKDQPEQS